MWSNESTPNGRIGHSRGNPVFIVSVGVSRKRWLMLQNETYANGHEPTVKRRPSQEASNQTSSRE